MKATVEEIVPDPGGRIIAVSDIHGYDHYLKGLLDKIHFSREDTLIIAGDMIEKGPESLKTIRLVLNLKEQYPNIRAVMGNVDKHRLKDLMEDSGPADQRFIRTLQETKDRWGRGLFLDMMSEAGISDWDISEENAEKIKKTIRGHFQKELSWIWNLPTVIAAGNFLFAHAGIPTENVEELRETDEEEILKRSSFLTENVKFKKYVVVGHWPVCLYYQDQDCMNPIFDKEKHIISIDGGCALKEGAQLNALILPDGAFDMENAYYESYDDFPVITAKRSQNERKASVRVRYFDCGVQILNRIGDMIRMRHLTTKKEFLVPESYLYYRNGNAECSDYSDGLLGIEKGDKISVVETTSVGMIVKKHGVIGWYFDCDEDEIKFQKMGESI